MKTSFRESRESTEEKVRDKTGRVGKMVNWQTLFMVSLRRQGSSSRYKYKFNMENITHRAFPRCKQAFKEKNLAYEYCDLGGTLYNLSLIHI